MTQQDNTAVLIAQELNVKVAQVVAAIQLLDEGSTVPFIARYRKEMTGNLDDTQLRQLTERLTYLRELNDRRQVVLDSIREQGKLTPELEQLILQADTKNRLEDYYLPYRPKRRTKAQIAIEAGIEPLANALLQDKTLDPEAKAPDYLNVEAGFADAAAVLDGVRHILMERFAEDAALIDELREYVWTHATLQSSGDKAKAGNTNKYADYFDYSEAMKKIPSHRALALLRGRREGVLSLKLVLPDPTHGEKRVATWFDLHQEGRAADTFFLETAAMCWKVKLLTKLELELLTRLRDSADEEAIRVFSKNLSGLLLAAPAGHQVTIGLDPGIRTGVKVAVVDSTGKLLDYTTVYPLQPQNDWHGSIAELAKLAAKYSASLISVGNGTGSRETERLVSELNKMYPDLKLSKVLVSEAGASVYSASELAAKEFPDVDVSIRGAVSIARRLQDPLAELVKIEPKAIGVGQYQHDVNQVRLARCLDGVVEDCVNAVGVDVNTASVSLLTRVAGLNESLAKNLVQYRDECGAFRNRASLLSIPRLGEKTFQQAAGFLRITNGENPLDGSAVHPESYPLVEKIAQDAQLNVTDLIGNQAVLRQVNVAQYSDFGTLTVQDVLRELEKPGRDPRPEFKTVVFKEGIEELSQLENGMILEGVVSNVTNFGAFVDIGVHQDGLVHISALTNRFVSDPHTVVKAGDIVTVRVVSVDKARRRIELSMLLQEEAKPAAAKPNQAKTVKPVKPNKQSLPPPKKVHKKEEQVVKKGTLFNTTMADAFAKLKGQSS